MKKLFVLIGSVFPALGFAIVDMRSAGYSKTFMDYKSKGPGFVLEIKRSYNSRSLFNGLFGFGWCSNLETRLSVLPDGSIKVTECGGGMEVVYHPKGKVPNVKFYVDSIIKKLKERKVRMVKGKMDKLRKDLLKSQNLRSEFIKALDIKGKVESNLKYFAQGRVKEYIVVTSTGYTRKLPNGLKEKFDKKGRLTFMSGQQGTADISWRNKKIQITDNKGRRLTFHLNPKTGKIEKALAGRKTVASYIHDGEDLKEAVNSNKETFEHRYDGFHNLKKTIYPDKTTEVLAYNVKKDWVISFKDRSGCKESYDYEVNKQNPDHYFSTVQKVCRRKIVNKSKYEFWHKTGIKGGKYLHRARVRVNGRLKKDVVYHPVFGVPTSFFENGVRTNRDYYANGLLMKRDNIYQTVTYHNYHTKCRKPGLVKVGYKNLNKGKKKFARKEEINFIFNKKCQLSEAKKSEDEWIKVGHDSNGRINSMEDQSRKKIILAWHGSLNKPKVITREGVGSIRIVYDSKGSVIDLKGLKTGPTVIAQVTSVFNSFLATLAPVSEEMVIL